VADNPRVIILGKGKASKNAEMQDLIDKIELDQIPGELIDSMYVTVTDPEEIKYSWWSYRAGARAKNVGWRIDYFLASEALKENIKDAEIHTELFGSDHCPVSIELHV